VRHPDAALFSLLDIYLAACAVQEAVSCRRRVMRGSNTRTPGPQLWRKRAGRLHEETDTRPCRCNHGRAQDIYRKSDPATR
jgi:hypothetical protein